MFKRPRLSAQNRLVNALPGLALLFIASACSGPSETPEIAPETTTPPPVVEGLTLPAVWNTGELDAPIRSIGVAGELGSTIAVAYDDGGLQFFNFEGDRITDKADLGAAQLGDGRYLLLSGVPVTVFPGVDTSGNMKVYIHGGQLPEPLAYDLDTGVDTAIAGLCTAPPTAESDGVLRLAFWTQNNPNVLVSGRIVQVGEELVFLPDEPVTADRPITACLLSETGATVHSAPILAAAKLERRGKTHVITLDSSGQYTVIGTDGSSETISIRDGISVKAPKLPTDMTGTGDTRGGGYPGGILIIAGEDHNGDNRLIFIDPGVLTLTAFE